MNPLHCLHTTWAAPVRGILLCFVAVVAAVQGSVFIEFDLSTNGHCTSDSLELDQTIDGSVSTMPIVENPILDQRHSLPVSVNTGETSIISFTWKRAVLNSLPPLDSLLTDCCWSVSNVTLTDDDSTINMTVNTCANGGTAYSCSGATWFCGLAVIGIFDVLDESKVISGSFKIIPSMINGEEMIEATVDSECSVDPGLFSILFPNELTAACEEEESSITRSIATALSPTTTVIEHTASQSPSAILTSSEISSTSQQATATSNANQPITVPLPIINSLESIALLPSVQVITPAPTLPVSVSQILTLPSNVMLPVIVCERDGIWIETAIGTTVTIQNACYCGMTAHAGTRKCMKNGEWAKVINCNTSMEFSNTLNLIQIQPEDGLNATLTLLTSNNATETDVQSLQQYQCLLQNVVQSQQEQDDFVSLEFVNVFLTGASELTNLIISNDANLDEEDQRSLGAQLLRTLDDFALTVVQPSNTTQHTIGSIVLTVLQFNEIPDDYITTLKSGYNSISHPPDIFGDKITSPIRIASFLYRNLSSILPPRNNDTSIVSPIISSTIAECQDCVVTYDLSNNVTIQLQIEVLPSNNKALSCVFFEFENSSNGESLTGDWSTDGCTTIVDGDIVTCSCNHLTHFAILLSPGIDEPTPIHNEVLNIIGLVLVPISLLCMVAVILTYSLMRSLWSIRNYIHIMLCVCLFVAQLVFIIGIDKIKNEGACSAIAVILQYLFLVTFMWMLMEGVVLYVTLVRVFIENHVRYVIGFTVASYVIPAVYMAIVVPIGFLVQVNDLPDDSHYLYYNNRIRTACWLNYRSGFIWSFIVPVAIIIVVNIGFFIMAFVIMKKHSKKQKTRGKSTAVKHWLKVSISLTLVMGIAWLAGVLAFRRELLFISYIMTVFIAGQGILLFIILIPLSKQVREAYSMFWARWKSQSTLVIWISSSTSSFFSKTTTANESNEAKRFFRRKPSAHSSL